MASTIEDVLAGRAAWAVECGDCLEVLSGLPHDRIDLLLADPPYGMNIQARTGTARHGNVIGGYLHPADRERPPEYFKVEGDDQPFDPSPWLDCKRVILWGGNHFASRLPDARCWVVWDKREGTGSNDQADCEMAWTNLPGPARLHRQLWNGICRRGEENVSRQARFHPTQKPVELMRFCIDLARLEPGSLVVDPYMGSGTTGCAAVRMGHRFIGCDVRPDYCEIARTRIEPKGTML
jgi:site-specific DNA-methyltransferase (adenine-specific)/modification methylase